MSVSNPQKKVTPDNIDCQGKAMVTISFDAVAQLTADPADIVLIMDRSGSMHEKRMIPAKSAAMDLVETVAVASGAGPEGPILGDSRICLVSFADSATRELPFTQNVGDLNRAISALTNGGGTNHTAAFTAAERVLKPKGTNRQVVVMFTDGRSNAGGDPTPVTDRMKAAGVEIFCIGLMDSASVITGWASRPASTHVAYTSNPARLEELFQRIAAEVVHAGASGVTIREELNPSFRLVRAEPPTCGTVKITGEQTLTWTIGQMGADARKITAALSFEIQHIGTEGGLLEVNRRITYQDRAGSKLTFPSPKIQVHCPGEPEPVPVPAGMAFVVPGCRDAVQIAVKNVEVPL